MKSTTFIFSAVFVCLFAGILMANMGIAGIEDALGYNENTGMWTCYPQTRYIKADLSVVNHPDLFKWKFAKKETVVPTPTPAPIDRTTPTPVPTRPEGKIWQPLPEKTVYFDYDKSLLKPEGKAAIQKNVQFLKQNPSYSILIEGHCDERGTEEYNIALGERRAEAVKNYMIDLGIEEERITTKSWGEEKPVDPGHNESAWRKNRRAEMFFSEN